MKTRDIVIISLLTALTIVISCFSFKIVIPGFFPVKITFTLVTIFFVAVKFSPLKGAIVASLAYIIQSIIFAKGSFFPGFILTDFLSGLIAGYSFKLIDKLVNKKLKSKNKDNIVVLNNSLSDELSFGKCLFSVAITKLSTCLINTLWLCLLLHAPFCFLFFPRLIAAIFMIITITPMTFGLFKFLKHIV